MNYIFIMPRPKTYDYDIDVQQLGQDLRQLRKSARLTLDQLSKLTGIGRVLINAYELGKNVPGPEYLDKILRALGAKLSIKTRIQLRIVEESYDNANANADAH